MCVFAWSEAGSVPVALAVGTAAVLFMVYLVRDALRCRRKRRRISRWRRRASEVWRLRAAEGGLPARRSLGRFARCGANPEFEDPDWVD